MKKVIDWMSEVLSQREDCDQMPEEHGKYVFQILRGSKYSNSVFKFHRVLYFDGFPEVFPISLSLS